MTVTTRSAAETERVGECLGTLLVPGDVVTLAGDLGAGKTRFSQGVAAGLGVDRTHPVTSPTFTILNEYLGRYPLYHFDFYRLGVGEDLRDLGFEVYFADEGVCLVEWPERLSPESFTATVSISLEIRDEEIRLITIGFHGDSSTRRLEAFGAELKKVFDRATDSCY